jgi:tetratricopeptide (TPR) repeat protein
MRIPARVGEGEEHFRSALLDAAGLDAEDRQRLIAKAHKELGFYYRNMGKWQEADDSYERARDAISESMLTRNTNEDREEMASIQTNWAYLKGLSGSYVEGLNLIESAINVRQKLGNRQEEGNSWSVYGEVCRYHRRYLSAWQAYALAERIFQELRNWAWLGVVYQEQAVCAFQANASGLELVPAPEPNPEEWAKRQITVALDLCRDLAVRSYPSALNRAGRIFGATNSDAGLAYLADGIEPGQKVATRPTAPGSATAKTRSAGP